MTRGGQAPGETGGEITKRGAWAQINFNVLKIRLKHIPLNFLGLLELLDFIEGFCVIGIKLQLLFLLQGAAREK